MEGRDPRRGLASDGSERVLVNFGDGGRMLASGAMRVLQANGLACDSDHVVFDGGDDIPATTLAQLEVVAIVVMAIGRRCRIDGWRIALLQRARELGVHVVVLFEGREQEWRETVVPSMVTADLDELAGFTARSRPDIVSLRELADIFLVDRLTASLFRREHPTRWRWLREPPDSLPAVESELSLSEMSELGVNPGVEVTRVEARSEAGAPILLLATAGHGPFRLAWSRDIRAVIPAPVWPGIEPIGFMHCDFDTAKEWPRAGRPPVEIRLLGLEVYGWHMSEYFWRAFVGSLPRLLGRQSSETPEGVEARSLRRK